jgi:hypothetical protein
MFVAPSFASAHSFGLQANNQRLNIEFRSPTVFAFAFYSNDLDVTVPTRRIIPIGFVV